MAVSPCDRVAPDRLVYVLGRYRLALMADGGPSATGRHDHLMEQPDAVNIGWLGAGHEFPAGQAPGWLVPGMLKLVRGGLVNLTRGYHMCHLCQRSHWPPIGMEFDGREQMLGNGEIRVRGAEGTLYAAPSLIVHYVAEHSYLPPDCFIDAIREAAHAGKPGSSPPADRV